MKVKAFLPAVVIAVVVIGLLVVFVPKIQFGSKEGEALISQAALYEKESKIPEARDAYKKAYETYPDPAIVKVAKPKTEELSMKILFSPLVDSNSKEYTVQAGDTLVKIAKVFGTTVGLIKKSNNLAGDNIRQGQR